MKLNASILEVRKKTHIKSIYTICENNGLGKTEIHIFYKTSIRHSTQIQQKDITRLIKGIPVK